MPTFVHAVGAHGQLSMDYGFVLKLSSISDLLDYWEKKREGEFSDGIKSYLQSKEFEYATKGTYSGKGHVANKIGEIFASVCFIEGYKEDNERGSVQTAIGGFVTRTLDGMVKLMKKTGAIYVQQSGGYFPHSDDLVIHKTLELGGYDFPDVDRKIKITQWSGGTHFYAKVGYYDVVDADGNQKWDTHEEAERQAEIFAKKLPARKRY